METSGEILELIEDEDIPNYVSDTLNYIASNMAEFANNILKESMMKEDILKENVENIINIANNLYDSTNIKTNNYIEKIGELIDEYKRRINKMRVESIANLFIVDENSLIKIMYVLEN